MERMDSRELAEREVLESIDPDTPHRADLRIGNLAAFIGGVLGVKPAVTPDRFVLYNPDRPAKREVDPEKLGKAIRAMSMAFGGKVKRGDNGRKSQRKARTDKR